MVSNCQILISPSTIEFSFSSWSPSSGSAGATLNQLDDGASEFASQSDQVGLSIFRKGVHRNQRL